MAENNSSAPLKTAEGAYPALPAPDAWRYTDARGHYRYRGKRAGFATEYQILKPEPLYTAEQMRAYADQAVAAQAAPAAVAVPDEREAFEAWGRAVNLGLERVGERPYYWQYARWAWDGWQARAALAATPALPATEDSSAGDLSAPTDAEIIALNDGERFFSTSESRFGKEVNPHTQYHTGEPGYLKFARAVLARWGSATQAPAEVQAQPADALDTERLDWILRQGDEFSCYVIQDAPGDGDYWVTGMKSSGQHKDPRAAIDAAMAAAQEGGNAAKAE